MCACIIKIGHEFGSVGQMRIEGVGGKGKNYVNTVLMYEVLKKYFIKFF